MASCAWSANLRASSPVNRPARSWNAEACRRSSRATVPASSTSSNSKGTGRVMLQPRALVR
jgi:hypothetical protein